MNSNKNVNSNSIKGLLKNKSLEIYDKTEKIVSNTSTPIKIVTAMLSFFLLIFFTKYQFNFFLSVSLALVTLLTLATINKILAISFGFIYGYYMYQLMTGREKTFGKVLKETDIEVKDGGGPMVTSKTELVVKSSDLDIPSVANNFSYQFWMYINGIQIKKDDDNYVNTWDNYRYGQWKSVFYRGDPLMKESNLTENEEQNNSALDQVEKIQQYPGVWLAPYLNNLSFVFNSGTGGEMERIEIADVPMNEWFCVTILVEGYSVTIYMNGEIVNTMLLNQVFPSDLQNKNLYFGMDNVLNVCQTDCGSGTKGGWPGFLSEFIFYPYVLTNKEIFESYLYYKKIVSGYQDSINRNITNTYPTLINKNSIVNTDSYDPEKEATTDNNINNKYINQIYF